MDIATLGLSVDSKPVEQATQALNKFSASGKTAETAGKNVGAATGAMSKEMTAAVAHATALNQRLASVEKSAKLSSYAMTNLAFQLNDVATMAALGADPMRILASQAGQFYQILATGQGGVRGSLGYLKDTLVGMVTPARAVAGGLALIGTTAAIALKSAVDEINEANIALAGIGQGSGVAAAQIQAMAIAAAEAGQQSVSGAREIALAVAATGKVNEEIITKLIGVSRQFAATFGEDGPDAAKRLAAAFADPAKGVDDLNKRLGAFDARTRQAIISLTAQNRVLDAQRLMLEGVNNSVVGSQESTSKLERTWRELTDAMSTYWAKLRQGMDGSTSIEDQFAAVNKEIEKYQRWSNRPFGGNFDKELRDALKQREDLIRAMNLRDVEIAAQASQKKSVGESNAVDDIARRTIPDYDQLRRAADEWIRLRDAIANSDVMNRLDGFSQLAVIRAKELREGQAEWLKKAIDAGGVAVTQAREEHEFALQTIAARSASQRADIAFRRELARLNKDDPGNAEERARLASAEVLAQANESARRAAEQRVFAADQSIEAAERELALVGETAGVRSREISLLQVKQQLENDALQNSGNRNAYDRDHLKILEDRVKWQSQINDLIQQETLQRDLAFEREQMGRSEREQNVYGRLQSAGLLTNGQVVGAQAEMIAAQIRFNEVMRLSQDYSKEFATGFVRDMREGVSASESLGNALNRLADRLSDMAMDQAFSALFAPMSKGVAAGATGGLEGLFAGVFHQGGEVGRAAPQRYVPAALFAGAKRYHNGGVIGADEVPAILQKGERVIPRGRSGGVNVTVTISSPINAQGAYPESIEQIKAALAAQQANLPQQITQGVRDSLDRGLA